MYVEELPEEALATLAAVETFIPGTGTKLLSGADALGTKFDET